jgi:hypothetical protein
MIVERTQSALMDWGLFMHRAIIQPIGIRQIAAFAEGTWFRINYLTTYELLWAINRIKLTFGFDKKNFFLNSSKITFTQINFDPSS